MVGIWGKKPWGMNEWKLACDIFPTIGFTPAFKVSLDDIFLTLSAITNLTCLIESKLRAGSRSRHQL